MKAKEEFIYREDSHEYVIKLKKENIGGYYFFTASFTFNFAYPIGERYSI